MLAGALSLLLAAGLQANPDGKGWVQAKGWGSFVDQESFYAGSYYSGSDPVIYAGYGDRFYKRSRRAAEAALLWPLTDAWSLKGAWRGAAELLSREIRLYSGGVHGQEAFNYGFAGLELGLTWHSGAWKHGAHVPGAAVNPDGWVFWPSLSLGSGFGRAWDERRDPDAIHLNRIPIQVGVEWPVATWLTLAVDYDWVEAQMPDAKVLPPQQMPMSPYETSLDVGLRLFWGQHRRGPWQPRLGPPGALRLTVSHGYYYLDDRSHGNYFTERASKAELMLALPSGFAVSLDYLLRYDPNYMRRVDHTTQIYQHSLGLGLRWAWGLSSIATEAVP